jgi:hypothetical protein
MKDVFLTYFSAETIANFYRKKGKGPDSSDYELIISLLLKEFMDDMFKKEHIIGFHINNKFRDGLTKTAEVTLEMLEKIIRQYVDQSSPIDVLISAKNDPSRGSAFQLKRFGKNVHQADTDSLVDYLNSLHFKYAEMKRPIRLVIVFDGNTAINFVEVSKAIISQKMPFTTVMYFFYSEGQLRIGELWPNNGFNRYQFVPQASDGKHLKKIIN